MTDKEGEVFMAHPYMEEGGAIYEEGFQTLWPALEERILVPIFILEEERAMVVMRLGGLEKN